MKKLTLFRLGFFGVPGPWVGGGGGGGREGRAASKALLYKSESTDAIAMKLGGR